MHLALYFVHGAVIKQRIMEHSYVSLLLFIVQKYMLSVTFAFDIAGDYHFCMLLVL